MQPRIRARRVATRQRFSDSSRGDPVPMSVTSERPPSSSSIRNTRSASHRSMDGLPVIFRVVSLGAMALSAWMGLIGRRDQPDDQLCSLGVLEALMRQRLPGLEGDGVADRGTTQSGAAAPGGVQHFGNSPRI